MLTILEVYAGFAAAELVILGARVPGLLRPLHLRGLAGLVLSDAILYAGGALICILFAVAIHLVCRLFRSKPAGAKTGLAAVIAAPLLMILINSLQARILGTYLSLNSPLFLLPLGVAAAVFVISVGLVSKIMRPFGSFFDALLKPFTGVRLVLAAGAVFAVIAMTTEPSMNILGIFNEREQRRGVKESSPQSPDEAPPGAPNFVVIAVECFRDDSFNHKTAPFLWKLAEENCRLSNYYVSAPATRPSVTSFLTSLYPVQHGCYNMAGGRTATGGRMVAKVPEESTASLPKLLQNRGYRTVMVTSNSLTMDRAFGFENCFYLFDAYRPYGFEFPYFEPFHGFHFLRSILHYFRIFKVLFFSPEHSTTYFDGPRLNKTILREFEKIDNRPFFFYIHYIEPHSPYYMHPYKPVQVNLYLPSRRADIMKAYESEITSVDRVIKELYDYLDGKGLLKNTYLFISADHGEEFHDHGNWGHGKTLFPEVLHVPAILAAPPSKRVQKDIDAIVEAVDIVPTLAELADMERDDSWQGHSILPLMQAAPAPSGTTAWDDSMFFQIALSQFDDGHTFQAGAVADSLLVILHIKGGSEKMFLYDLISDPEAKRNIFDWKNEQSNTMADLLEKNLRRLYKASHQAQGKDEAADEHLMEQLRTLGYID